jgi:hypothetical protein
MNAVRALFPILVAFFSVSSHAMMTCSQNVRAFGVVEPYSSGIDLVARAIERGLHVVPIFLSDHAPSGYSFDRAPFADRLIVHRGNLDATVDQLVKFHQGRFQLSGIATGAESGGPFSDDLRDAVRARGIAVLGNGLELSESRRDKKFLDLVLPDSMKPRQIVTDDFSRVEAWLDQHGIWPVMVKQAKGAGGEKSRFCYTRDEVHEAFHAILGRTNGMLEVDRYVVVQEALEGPEIGVNGVRAGGRTYFTGFWKYGRPRRAGAGTIYDSDWLMKPSRFHDPIRASVSEALDRMGHRVGPFHIEVFVTGRGPLITDANIRLSGHRLPWLESITTNLNPFDMTIDAYLDGQLVGLDEVYTRNQYAGTISVSSEGDGGRMSYALKPQLKQMKADGLIADFEYFFPEGHLLSRTVDSDTVAAAVWVKGSNRGTVIRVMRQIQRWQRERKFETHP